ncbi:MAG TPA: hypothetical protein VLG27_03765 [Candidatus Saccharimonadia bacterium]|nr:hypothetical protein [Candidatus Saccharimonadia bacterium]
MGQVRRFGDSVRLAFATLLTIGSALAIGLSSFGSAGATAFNNGGMGCSVEGLMPLRSAFTISGNTATTQVQVNGPASCMETVTLSSWKAPIGSPNFRPFQNQQFVTSRTFTLGPGTHSLSVMVDNSCSFQVDLLLGSNPRSATGDANFSPDQVIGFLQVSNGVCQAPTPPPTPTPPAPTPTPPAPTPTPPATTTTNNVCSGGVSNTTTAVASQGGNCSTNTTVVQNQTQTPAPPATPAAPAQSQTQSQSANVAASAGTGGTASNTSAAQTQAVTPAVTTSAAPVTTSAAPTSLVNTGPATIGGMIGLFTGVTLLGTFAYDMFLRRKLAA